MALPQQKLSLEEYLAWENVQPDRNEFYQGEVFAMVGGRRTHERIIANLVRHLGNQLDGSPCQVFAAGLKLRIADDAVLYPDVMVTCDKQDLAAESALRSPKQIIEVLSPSTQAYDRSAKFALYRRLVSLQEYILIDPETKRIDAFRRNELGQWVLFDMSQDETLECASIACSVPMAQVFEGMSPDQ